MTIHTESTKSVTAETNAGTVEGFSTTSGAASFRGIPYAAPPIGELRFKRPRPHPGWTGVRTLDDANAARQSVSTSFPGIGIFMIPLRQDEDCLHVNVWVPQAALGDGGKRPVFVYIHGGGNVTNAGSNKLYDGTRLALDGDVVVVTMNYRLSVLGFIHFGLVSEEFEEAINLGFYDQVAALRWVRYNIAAFGGDPDNVTVVGESTGASAISNMLVSPLAQGLFRRVVLQSLSFFSTWCTQTEDEARETASKALDILGLSPRDASALWTMPFESMFKVQQKLHEGVFERNEAWRPMGGCVDPASIPKLPARALVEDRIDVPVVIGWAQDEWRFIAGFSDTYKSMDRATAERLFRRVVGAENAARFYDEYARMLDGDATPTNVAHAFMSFEHFKFSSYKIAQHLASIGKPTHVYQFSWRVPGLGGQFGAPHGADNAFIFDNWHVWKDVPMMEGAQPTDTKALTQAMHGAWLAFIQTGDPNHNAMPNWPAFGAGREVMLFNAEPRVLPGLLDEECALWASAGISEVADLERAFSAGRG